MSRNPPSAHPTPSVSTAAAEPNVVVSDHGTIPEPVVAHARDVIARLVRYSGDQVPYARVRLSHRADPAVGEPAIAQANLDVNGRLVRAQATAPGPLEAIDRLEARLRQRLARVHGGWEARRGRWPSPAAGEWRHGQWTASHPAYYRRPAAEREVVRHKAFGLSRMSVDEAAFDMDMLDYEFHLFTEETTGRDCVLYRAADGGLHLLQGQQPAATTIPPPVVDVRVDRSPAPSMTDARAVDRLDLTGASFVFYTGVDSKRGRVLYRRYDGHYGLLTPAV
jgi:ribosome-associated translation inhibitor RaiA